MPTSLSDKIIKSSTSECVYSINSNAHNNTHNYSDGGCCCRALFGLECLVAELVNGSHCQWNADAKNNLGT
jgi:hypothetical protein